MFLNFQNETYPWGACFGTPRTFGARSPQSKKFSIYTPGHRRQNMTVGHS